MRRIISIWQMLFDTLLLTSAHYFVYLNPRLGWNSDLDKIVFVKLSFDRTIFHVCDFLNSLDHALNNFDNPNNSVEKDRCREFCVAK